MKTSEKQNITLVALTGGPCGGKTTALASIKEHFTERGYNVVVVPEIPTIVINSGFAPNDLKEEERPYFQDVIFKLVLQLENNILRLAKNVERKIPTLIIFDRGIMDGKAFTPLKEWKDILKNNKETEISLKSRYDAIIHLVTAPKEHYTLENNRARQEDYKGAVKADANLQQAWLGTKRHFIVDNQTDFNGKISRVISIISSLLGLSEEKKKTAILLSNDLNIKTLLKNEEIPYEMFQTKEVHLKKHKKGNSLLKSTTHRGNSLFYIVTQEKKEVIKERIITDVEYNLFLLYQDERKEVKEKTLYTFLYQNAIYEIEKRGKTTTLQITSKGKEEKHLIPQFIKNMVNKTSNPKNVIQ